jgi:hypothetical protein
MRLHTSTSTAVALGVLASGLLAVASVQAQSSGTLTQERLMTQQRIQSQQMLRDGTGASGSALQNQFQNQQRQQLQFQPRASQGTGIPGGSGSGAKMGNRGGRR